MSKILYGCFCGLRGLEIGMTKSQAQSASHQGECSADVKELSKVPEIRKQLNDFKKTEVRDALKEYGAWSQAELRDHEENLQKALWLAAGDIVENSRK